LAADAEGVAETWLVSVTASTEGDGALMTLNGPEVGVVEVGVFGGGEDEVGVDEVDEVVFVEESELELVELVLDVVDELDEVEEVEVVEGGGELETDGVETDETVEGVGVGVPLDKGVVEELLAGGSLGTTAPPF